MIFYMPSLALRLTSDVKEIIELQKTDMTNQMIADKYNVGRSTLLKYVSEYKNK